MGRRHPPTVPNFSAVLDVRAAEMLERFCRALLDGFDGDVKDHGKEHLQTGIDPIPKATTTPVIVKVGGTPTPGSGPGYMMEDAQLAVTRGTILGLGDATANGTSTDGASADHVHKREVEVEDAGGLVGKRRKLKLIVGGTGLTRAVTDNAGSDLVQDSLSIDTPLPTVPSAYDYGILYSFAVGSVGWGGGPFYRGISYPGNALGAAANFDILELLIPADDWGSYILDYEVNVNAGAGTDQQLEFGKLVIHAFNKGGVGLSSWIEVLHGPLQRLGAGALTVAWTLVNNATPDRVTLRLNVTSTLGAATTYTVNVTPTNLAVNNLWVF